MPVLILWRALSLSKCSSSASFGVVVMFESDSAVPSANDFSLWISSQIESDAETEFLFSAREKLDMSRRRQAAKLDIIAITCNIFSTLGWLVFMLCVGDFDG